MSFARRVNCNNNGICKSVSLSLSLTRYKNISLIEGEILKNFILEFNGKKKRGKFFFVLSYCFVQLEKRRHTLWYFFFNFPLWEKNSKISCILVFCMVEEGGIWHWFFILFFIILVVGEILARLEINSSLFSFHPVGKLDWKFY